ncbi:hypothetical protein ABZP36_030630 [Zizania latifolia]
MAVVVNEVIQDKAAMRVWSCRRHTKGKTVTVVPTMGYFHQGHLSLVSTTTASADPIAIIITIYVNPSQFAPTEELAIYPSDFIGTQSLYVFSSLGELFYLFTGANTIAMIMLALSGSTRSNGALNAG